MPLNDDQLAEVFESVYERSDANAPEAPAWSAIPKPTAGNASGWRGPLIAVVAAAAVFLIIGAVGVLFASWSGSDAPPASGTVEGMVLELYLANDIDDEQLQLITETLTTQSGVIDWRYISKAEAYEAALVQYADSEDALRIVEENPDHFTASIRLLVTNATDMRVIRTFAFETFPAPDSGLMGGGGGWGTLANPPFGISLPLPPINGGWALESISISGVETAVGPGVGSAPLAWIEIGTALAGHADCTSFRGPPDGYSFTDGVLIPGEITVRNLECDSFIVDAFVGMLHDNPDGIDVEFTTSGMVWAAEQSRLVFSRRYLPAAIAHDGQNPKIPAELPSGEVTALPAIVLVKGAEVGDIYTTGFAADATAFVDLWQELGLVGSPPAIDFISRVVLYFGAVESSSCPLGPLLGLVYNHGNQSIHPLMSPVASAQDADSGVMTCTADARRHALLVSVERRDLPDGAFSLWISEEDPPGCCLDGLTFVAAGELNPPTGASFDPLGANGDLGVGETRIAYDVNTHCGVEWLSRSINGQRWHAVDLASSGAVGIDPVPSGWGEANDLLDLLVTLVDEDTLEVTTATSNVVITYVPEADAPGCD